MFNTVEIMKSYTNMIQQRVTIRWNVHRCEIQTRHGSSIVICSTVLFTIQHSSKKEENRGSSSESQRSVDYQHKNSKGLLRRSNRQPIQSTLRKHPIRQSLWHENFPFLVTVLPLQTEPLWFLLGRHNLQELFPYRFRYRTSSLELP